MHLVITTLVAGLTASCATMQTVMKKVEKHVQEANARANDSSIGHACHNQGGRPEWAPAFWAVQRAVGGLSCAETDEAFRSVVSLDLSSNNLSNIAPLQHGTQLKRLILKKNHLSDLYDLRLMKGLEELDLSDNWLEPSGLGALTHLPEIRVLRLSNHAGGQNIVRDLSSLRNMTKLKKLVADNISLADVTTLSDLKDLTQLSLRNNPIHDVTALSGLKNLEYLDLSGTQITSIAALKDLKNLKKLKLIGLAVYDGCPLAEEVCQFTPVKARIAKEVIEENEL